MSIATPETGVNPYSLYDAFAATEYGQKLAGSIRFGRYKPDGMPNDDWVHLLGPDVNNLQHNALTLGLTDDFIRQMDDLHPGELTDHEKLLLRVGAVSHDWGEAVVGDVTHSQKTKEGELREREAFLEIMATAMSEVPGADLVVEAAHEVVFDQKGTRLGRMFNIVERVGYMRTALRAHVRVEMVEGEELQNGLRWLTADVLGNNPVALIGHARWLRPPQQYLIHESSLVTSAFGAVRDEVYANYGEEAGTKRAQIAKSQEEWFAWLAEQSEPRSE